jgi:hypothetical protein
VGWPVSFLGTRLFFDSEQFYYALIFIMPIPIALAAAAVPTLYKGIKGIIQGFEADDVKLRDTEPAAHKEALALGRQAQAAGLPGAATYRNRIEAGVNDTLSAATRAGTSGSSVLGLLEKADANRNQALNTLGTREDTYHQGQNRHLEQLLKEQAGYQLADQRELDKNRAALDQASNTNIFNAVTEGSQLAAYALGKPEEGDGLNSSLLKKAGKKVAAATGTISTGPDDILNRRVRYNEYGVPDYGPLRLGGLS